MTLTFASLFSGGGGADLGAIAAGLRPIWGVENNPQIATTYQENIGAVICRDILELDPKKFERPDWLHASPVCKAFSSANANKGEKDWDIQCGHQVAEFIEILQPKYFSLENVRAYRGSRAFEIIVQALNAQGYHCTAKVINAADYGVPQSRERLFLVAYRGDFRWGWSPFHGREKHRGWYQAIADLLPDTDPDQPHWDTANRDGLPHGIQREIADGGHVAVETIGRRSDRPPLYRLGHEPIWTIRALGHDAHWHKFRWFSYGLTGLVTVKMLARLQSFPDWYKFPAQKVIVGTIIGNSVPPLLMQKLIEETVQ